ncbi:MAG: type II secretion system protein [Candidatus Nomurabacteria bacterium]|nr:type II secretion system protein [Candidatus Nomurabacteria bacterium]
MINKKNQGFTLIELLVVIAIIGILSSVILAALNSARAKARDARRMRDINEINNAVALYVSANGHAPDFDGCDWLSNACFAWSDDGGSNTWAELETALKPYMKNLPVDPCGSSCNKTSELTSPDGSSYIRLFRYEYVYNPKRDDPTNYMLVVASLETTDTYMLPGFEIGMSY